MPDVRGTATKDFDLSAPWQVIVGLCRFAPTETLAECEAAVEATTDALAEFARQHDGDQCERDDCGATATHLSGIGNERPHQRLCPDHTNERVAADERVWFRSLP